MNVLTDGLDETKLQSYIDTINQIKNAQNTTNSALFDKLQVEEYAVALKDVEASQAALLLSTQGLTNAQIAETLAVNESTTADTYKAMADAGLLKSKQKLTVAEIQENLQTVLGAEADTSATMTSLGLSAAIEGQEHQTVQLTAKKLQEAVATGVLTKAQAQELAMRTGVMLSMGEQAATTMPTWTANMKAMTLATWEQVKATVAWLATNPAVWVAAAIYAIYKLHDALTVTLKEQQEITENLQSELSEIQSDISDVDSKLDNIGKRIDELNSKDSLSFVEKEELKNLTLQNDELERRNMLLAEDKENKQKEVAESVKKEFDKEYGNKSYEQVFSESQAKDISKKRKRYNELYLNNGYNTDKELEELEILKHELEEFDSRTTVSFEEHVQEVISAYEELNKKKLDGEKLTKQEKKDLKKYRKELVNTATTMNDYSEKYGLDDDVNQSWKDLSQNISEVLYPDEYITKKFDEVFNNLSEDVQSELKEMAVNGSLSVESLSDDIIDKFKNAGFSVTEVIEQILASVDGLGKKAVDGITVKTSLPDKWESLKTTDNDELKNTREELLALAEAGRLTEEIFHETTGTDTFLESINGSLPETIRWINQLVSSADQLTSLKKQISGISDALATKKSDKFVDTDTLSGFSAEVKGLESWDEFERLLGDSKSSMSDCQEAANRLATEFINTNNFLANLNQTNKDYYITQLQNMGVANAREIVEWQLENVIKAQEYATVLLSNSEYELIGADGAVRSSAAANIQSFLSEGNASDELRVKIFELVAQQNVFSNSSISVNDKISALSALASAYLSTADAARIASMGEQLKHSGMSDEKIAQTMQNYISGYKPTNVNLSTAPAVKVSGGGSGKSGGSGGRNSAKESKTTIDWIERKLDILQKKIDATKAKFENLFSLKSKSKNIDKQIKQTTALLKAAEKTAKAYKKYADKVKLSKDLKKKVREGNYNMRL